MKILFLPFLIFFLSFHFGVAQEPDPEIQRVVYENPFSHANQTYIRLMNKGKSSEISGNLLRFKEWQKLILLAANGHTYEVDSSNYHYQEDLILYYDDGEMLKLDPKTVQCANIGGVDFIRLKAKTKHKKIVWGYYEVLVNKDFSLLKKTKMEEQVSNSNPMGLAASKKVELIRSSSYYYTTSEEDSSVDLLPRKKSELIQIFKKNRSKMIDFAKKNKIKTRDESDLIWLFDYYNQLVKEQEIKS